MASAEKTGAPPTTSSAGNASPPSPLSPLISSAEADPCAISRSARKCACRPSAAPRAASSSGPNEDLHWIHIGARPRSVNQPVCGRRA
eukprot:7280291-Pyramimonas_sp.AAC.1